MEKLLYDQSNVLSLVGWKFGDVRGDVMRKMLGSHFILLQTGELFQYHALGVKPFRIRLTEKYTIQKVKPIRRTTLPPAHNKQSLSITQFMLKNLGENSEEYQQDSSNS